MGGAGAQEPIQGSDEELEQVENDEWLPKGAAAVAGCLAAAAPVFSDTESEEEEEDGEVQHEDDVEWLPTSGQELKHQQERGARSRPGERKRAADFFSHPERPQEEEEQQEDRGGGIQDSGERGKWPSLSPPSSPSKVMMRFRRKGCLAYRTPKQKRVKTTIVTLKSARPRLGMKRMERMKMSLHRSLEEDWPDLGLSHPKETERMVNSKNYSPGCRMCRGRSRKKLCWRTIRTP